MIINEENVDEFLGIKFEYGKSSNISCDCFGLFLLILKKYSKNKMLYNEINQIFCWFFYNQNLCFEKINEKLLHYKTFDVQNNANLLVVIKIKKRLHCGIVFWYKNNLMVLHAFEKHGVVLTNYERFFGFGNEIARYNMKLML